jgi:tripartite-type tricarboxylate transporter receptor subunit TctC
MPSRRTLLALALAAWSALPVLAQTCRMNEEINKALKVPEIAAKLAGQGMTVVGGTPDAARAFIDKQMDTWAQVVKENNIKAD